MTNRLPRQAKATQSKQPNAGTPKFQMHQSPTTENITIHFSALGKDDKEDDGEIFMSAPTLYQDDTDIVTGLEASEDMFEDALPELSAGGAARPESALTETKQTSHSDGQRGATSSPSKSLSFPTSDKPFLSLVKSLSSDVEPKDGPSSSFSVKQRHLKNLVKSLSSDTSSQDQPPSSTPRIPESRLNLLRQFAQSRLPTTPFGTLGDSKTAPTSPMTSPENRSFFKVAEVEARIEDTKRRLTEAIAEPLQLLTKIMDEKSAYRSKVLSPSTSELSNLSSMNGHLESNNNYCIKEEDSSELEADNSNNAPISLPEAPISLVTDTKITPTTSFLSMSALAKQEDDEFCILTNEDFEPCADREGDGIEQTEETKVPISGSTEPGSDDDSECTEPAPSIPFYTLTILTVLIYVVLIFPWPSNIRLMLLGIKLGFFITLGLFWITGPILPRRLRYSKTQTKLDIEEPEMCKGWMNQTMNYDPESYFAKTQSVFVRLEGSTIRLSKPNRNIPRNAGYKDPKPNVTLISQKIYDLTNSKIYLLPPNLARKRVWNKKYPICIELAKQDDFMSRTKEDMMESRDNSPTKDKADGDSSAPMSNSVTLYLFGRTGREKEEWFQRFRQASKHKVLLKAVFKPGYIPRRRSLDEASLPVRLMDPSTSTACPPISAKTSPLLHYNMYMASLVPKQETVRSTPASSAAQSPMSSPGAGKKTHVPGPATAEEEGDSMAWFNATVGRLFWDFLREPCWAELVSKKIQRKLDRIHMPSFLKGLTLSELDMGPSIPRILKASKPTVDERGLWVDLDVAYSGPFLLTLETKVNFLSKEEESHHSQESSFSGESPRSSCLADSEEESSSCGSSDEEDSANGLDSESLLSKKVKRTVSEYFTRAAETPFFKRNVRNFTGQSPIQLTVEIQEVRGTLAINIPPPPTNRIWYGFRTPPHLDLTARTKLGEKEWTLSLVIDWIEKRIKKEFGKIFVMPNMDDVWLTIMHSAMDQDSQEDY